MKLKGLVKLAAAGQLDAGLSSLATFGLQIFTVSAFSPVDLGAFGLIFSAFVTAARIPSQLVYNPVEVVAVDHPADRRISSLRTSLPRGFLVGLAAAIIPLLGGLPAIADVERPTWLILVVTGGIVTVISPLQDHLRRLFHICHRSWWSVEMALVQTVGVGIGIVVLRDIDVALVPFGSLILANVLSITYGMARSFPSLRESGPLELSRSARRQLAGWLFLAAVFGSGLAYASYAIIGTLIGLAALGHIEAARVVARPIQVVSQGLMAIAGPRSMEAASARDWPLMKSWRRRYGLLLAAVAVPFVALTVVPSDWNIIGRLVPNAYIVPGLVTAMLAAMWLQATNLPMEAELLGFKRANELSLAALVGGLIEASLSVLAGLLLEYTFPIVVAAAALARRFMYRSKVQKHLWAEPETRSSPVFSREES